MIKRFNEFIGSLNTARVARQAFVIAVVYAAITVGMSYLDLANPDYQLRISEAMCVLPYFLPAAVPGLFFGCIIGNFLGGCAMIDIIFGSLATLVSAIITACLRKKSPWLAPIPALVINTIVIPILLPFCQPSMFRISRIPIYMIRVGAGEFVCCFVLGMLLLMFIKKKFKHILWW